LGGNRMEIIMNTTAANAFFSRALQGQQNLGCREIVKVQISSQIGDGLSCRGRIQTEGQISTR
jgi:hypothetical protein